MDKVILGVVAVVIGGITYYFLSKERKKYFGDNHNDSTDASISRKSDTLSLILEEVITQSLTKTQ